MPIQFPMSNKYLSYIADQNLIDAVSHVVASFPENGKVDISRNQLDPFGAFFECISSGLDIDTWKASESARQAQKTIQNRIGDFHQKIFGSLKGCVDVPRGKGLDIINVENRWCAEIKNKYNTTKGNHLPKLYEDIALWVDHYSAKYRIPFTGYYVQIIPRRPVDFDSPFFPSDHGVTKPKREDIREISGALFFDMITGEKDSLEKLYLTLPQVFKDHFGKSTKLSEKQLTTLFSINIR